MFGFLRRTTGNCFQIKIPMIKTLTRTVIIREYDFKKICQRAIPGSIWIKNGLYDRASFEPCLRVALEQEYVLRILQGKTPYQSHPLPTGVDSLLYHLRDRLYNRDYASWHQEEDEQGYIWVWCRKNTPKTRLGLATFERQYVVADTLTENTV
jgi:hypothetical protein